MAELVSIKRNVDVSPGQAAPAVFHCSQGDVGSKIILGLLNNGTAYSIPSGVTVTIEGSESNGSIFTPISATASGSDITFYLTGEMTAVAGPAICQAVLKSGSNILGTANFTLEVESSPMGADAPPVFTDAGWTWMLNKLTTEFVPALGDNIIDAIDSKLDKNQGTANAGKYLKVGADGNVETAGLDVTTDKTLSITDKAADAKAVGGELTNLKAGLSDKEYNNAKVLTADDNVTFTTYFQQGTIDSYGNEKPSTIRVRSPFIELIDLDSLKIQASSGYYVAVELYDISKTFRHELGFTANERIIERGDTNDKAYYIRLLLCKTDNSNITPSEADGHCTIVANSILTRKLTELNDKFSLNETDLKTTDNWSYGSRANNGAVNVNNTRIHSEFKRVKKGDIIFTLFNNSINAGEYYVEAVIFDNNMNHLISSGWKDNVYIIPCDGIVSVNARKRDDSQITNEDFADMVEKIYYTSQPVNKSWECDAENTVKAINHRGWHEAPENTLPAYVQSSENGFRYVETDIRFTSDNVPVCLHDATINRTGRLSDGSEITDTINIYDITLEQAESYDFGIYKGTEYAGTKIPTLSEFLNLCKSLNLLPYIDIGSTPMLSQSQIETIVETVFDCGMSDKTTYLAGQLAYGVWITHKDKTARVGCVTSLNTIYTNYAKALMTGYNEVFMDVQTSNISASTLENAKVQSLPVEVWTVNSETVIDELDEYITGISSDSINADNYLKSKNSGILPRNKPTALYQRVNALDGGYYVDGRKVYVNMKIQALVNHNSTPGVLTGLPKPSTNWCVLNCIRSDTDINNNISNIIPCGISNVSIYLKEIAENGIYYITGMYLT